VNYKACQHFKDLGGKRTIHRMKLECKNAQKLRMCRRCPAYPKDLKEKAQKIKKSNQLAAKVLANPLIFSHPIKFPDGLDITVACPNCPQFYKLVDNIGSIEWLGRFNARVHVECPFCHYMWRTMVRLERPPLPTPKSSVEGKRVISPR